MWPTATIHLHDFFRPRAVAEEGTRHSKQLRTEHCEKAEREKYACYLESWHCGGIRLRIGENVQDLILIWGKSPPQRGLNAPGRAEIASGDW